MTKLKISVEQLLELKNEENLAGENERDDAKRAYRIKRQQFGIQQLHAMPNVTMADIINADPATHNELISAVKRDLCLDLIKYARKTNTTTNLWSR